MNVILFGPPGAGKGTQGDLLAASAGLRKISTGDLLREAVRDGTELGKKAKTFMDAGELVPDAVILGLVRETLSVNGATAPRGFILDGFPRTLPQAQALDEMLHTIGQPIQGVLMLDVADDVIVKRLSGRMSCPQCGAVYNEFYDPPKHSGICDKCGTALVQRKDDNAETVKRRLDVYRQQTAPVLDYYRGKTTPVHTIIGDDTIDGVQRDLKKALGL
jgi:adenylate kinase